jgi:hypothetical protein
MEMMGHFFENGGLLTNSPVFKMKILALDMHQILSRCAEACSTFKGTLNKTQQPRQADK